MSIMSNNLPSLCLILCLVVLPRTTLQLPIEEGAEIQEQPNDISNFIGPGNNEENGNDPPVYIMVPVGDRSRRGVDVDGSVVSLDNVSYEVPTFLKFNESSKGEVEVSLIPNSDGQFQLANPPQVPNGYSLPGGPNNNCGPVNMNNTGPHSWNTNNNNNNNNNNKNQPMQPICLTLNIDSIFPPGKKIAVTNTSEIKGTGAILRVKFSEAKDNRDECRTTTQCAADFLASGLDPGMRQRLDAQKKRKFEDEDEDTATTQLFDQKTLQELIFKILTSNKTPKSTSPAEEVVFLDRHTTVPTYSFLINPSILQKLAAKRMTHIPKRATTVKSHNSPDFESLLKTVEHITSSMPKEKLLSLLSSLINKATLKKEMSTDQ